MSFVMLLSARMRWPTKRVLECKRHDTAISSGATGNVRLIDANSWWDSFREKRSIRVSTHLPFDSSVRPLVKCNLFNIMYCQVNC